ncbi:MAG: hypothetical protein GY720_15645 [bacterium]|nr:hypothetical protein [bacterium]
MSRRDEEPILVAEFATRAEAEEAWLSLVNGGVPSIVVTNDPPWGDAKHLIQCARQDAPAALRLLSAG